MKLKKTIVSNFMQFYLLIFVSTPLVIELEINCFNSISTGKLTQGVGLGSFPYKLLYQSQIELEKGFATNNDYVEQSHVICKC